ncbi:MAG: T9SS C-terminal target domain-containing protein [Ignavibacteriae bacterium]|nr:MAG: T9SS C-terminal target domain-containing protein [Ignavibacteriota bacterium]
MRLKYIFIFLFLIILRINSQWIVQPTGVTEILRSVYFVNPSTGTAVGTGSKIIKTTNGGLNWVNQPNSISPILFGVHFINANTGFVAADERIGKTTDGGNNWFFQTFPYTLVSVTFADSLTGYVCGGGGVILKTTNSGENWILTATNFTNAIWDISFINANTGLAAGGGSIILKTTNGGENWAQYPTGGTDNLFSVFMLNQNTGYTGADGGFLYKSTNGGENWTSLNSNALYRITDIKFCNQNTGTFVTLGGIVKRTTNAGLNWIEQSSGTTNDLYSLQFFGTDTGYAAGASGTIIKTTTGGFPPPAVPNLTAPPNNAQNVSLTPLMKWDTAANSQSYQLQVSTDSSFGTTVFDTTGILNIQHTIRTGLLNNNIVYYWRVRGFNNVGFGGWSSTWKFKTVVAIPLAPMLLLPVNGAINIPLSPYFDWDSTSPAAYYRLQISFDSSFVTAEPDINGITNSNLQLTAVLRNNALYYWRVSTTNAAGTGPWSLPNKFSTVITIPPPPLLVIPINNAQNVSLTPLLDWRDDISVINYQLQVSTDSLFTSPVVDNSTINVSQYTIPNNTLNNNTKYYWHVRTTNSLGTGNWSETWNFKTILSVPAAPVLIDPFNGAGNIPLNPLLNWDDNPNSTYRVQLCLDSGFTNLIINNGGLNISQYQVQGGSLTNNTTYYWRVNATNTAGTGPWSEIWHFTTIVSAPVAPPILLAPPNGATGVNTSPTLDWTDVFGAENYNILLSVDSSFSTNLIDTTSILSQFLIPDGKLSPLTKYYWKVRAQNVGGISPWSDIWNFTTGNAIGIHQISGRIPLEFKLYNNYPNPFNPVTKIRFDLPHTDIVKIFIYNLLGQFIGEILNEELSPGEYAVSWNGSSYASGVYIYRIVTSRNIDTKKMVLVK